MRRRVIGVDPGTRATGYGVVELQGNRLVAQRAGIIRTRTSDPLYKRLTTIYAELAQVVEESAPDSAAVESLFSARNPSSALKLGHARGVVLLALAHAGLDVADYSPAEVKQAVTGHGRAEKAQVAEMVRYLLRLEKAPASDAADALAVAMCHLMHRRVG